MTCRVLSLPQEIIRLIANYFKTEEDQNKQIVPFPLDWRNFLDTNKEYFGQWKKESQLIDLSPDYAVKFYESNKFRVMVTQLVVNPRLQINIQFRNSLTTLREIDLKQLSNVRKIVIPVMCNPMKIIPIVFDVEEISIHNYPQISENLGYFSQNKLSLAFLTWITKLSI
jgi:hypothetical protein